jgi:hypothetical protein
MPSSTASSSRHRAPSHGGWSAFLPSATAVAGVVIALSTGCSDDNPATVAGAEPASSLVAMSECKRGTDFTSDRGSDQDCIEWSYNGAGTLTLKHVNTAFNCCPEYDITLAVREGTIALHERETAGLCACLCVFDIELRVTDLPRGIYTITVEQEYLEPGEPTHVYELNLTEASTGSFCIPRAHYPWGLD